MCVCDTGGKESKSYPQSLDKEQFLVGVQQTIIV